MEVAFRMQTEAPEAFDISRSPRRPATRYGDADFGRGCLMAFGLWSEACAMVQLYFGNGQPWDNHDDILIHRSWRVRWTSQSPRCSTI